MNVIQKRLSAALLLVSFILIHASGQPGRGFNYQAIARDNAGTILSGQNLAVRLGIVKQGEVDELVWQEEHTVSTGELGIFNLTIGNQPGSRIGGSLMHFEEILWEEGSYALNVQVMQEGGIWSDMGMSPIMAVPVSIVSERVHQPLPRLTVQNATVLPEGEALFEVRKSDGRPVFAVYEDGVWVYTDTAESKGIKGGFAVGGYRKSAKGESVEEYMRVTPDSVRFYINDDPVKGKKGGFAVGGYRKSAKAVDEEYMSIFRDGIRFHVGYEEGKGRVGGFAISGKDSETGQPSTYLFLTPRNYFIGEQSGINNTTGQYNTLIGYRSGVFNTTGSENVMMGYVSGHQNISGNKNVFIGDSAGFHNTDGSWNIFMGRSAGLMNETGYKNVFIGGAAGEQNIAGKRNLFLGTGTGLYNVNGNNNCFLGQYAGFYSNASSNVFIGNYAGAFHEDGNDNVFIGNGAGNKHISGVANVYLGKKAGMNSDSSNFNVAIGNMAGETLKNGEMNVLVGHYAGYSLTGSSHNTFLGANTGHFTTNGSWNTFLGNNAGYENINGQDNTFIGSDAGRANTDGIGNVYVGISAGQNNNGNANVFIGSWSGTDNDGSGNIFIGNGTGSQMKGSNMLIIENGDKDDSQSLLYGRFDQDKLRMNAFVGISTPPDSAFALKADGDIQATDVQIVSDACYKTDIRSIETALSTVMKMKGITYRWNSSGFPDKKFDGNLHYGFIAQDLEKVIPELVAIGDDGYKSISYQKITPLLVEAMKQQQEMIRLQEMRIRKLESMIKNADP